MSIALTWRHCGARSLASFAMRQGSSAPVFANSSRLSRRTVPTSMSRKGVGTCWLTTRIISSGVIPLEASAATNDPALVPT